MERRYICAEAFTSLISGCVKRIQVNHFGVKIGLTKFMALRPRMWYWLWPVALTMCVFALYVKLLFEGCKVDHFRVLRRCSMSLKTHR